MAAEEKFAIRFGLGALKAVGLGMMETAIKERNDNGKFKDIYDFAERLDPRSVNKKSIEALAKAGAFDVLHKNRCQIAESFEMLSAYSAAKKEEASSNQMSLFGGIIEENLKPELKKVSDWNKAGRLQKEFEAFGYFLNEHPLDDYLSDLKKRGVIFSSKIENDELNDNDIVKMAGIVAGSKHRSGPRGRFAYLTVSDPFGMFEAMIFDEAMITSARDILVDGSAIALECSVRKGDGGIRISVKTVIKLDDFIKNTKAQDADFEDIKKQTFSRGGGNYGNRSFQKNDGPPRNYSNDKPKFETPKASAPLVAKPIEEKKIFAEVQIAVKDRDATFRIKSILSQLLASPLSEKFTKVFLTIVIADKKSKVELPGKYSLGEAEIARLRGMGFSVIANV
jgi:DNA polymerase III alpha subunit